MFHQGKSESSALKSRRSENEQNTVSPKLIEKKTAEGNGATSDDIRAAEERSSPMQPPRHGDVVPSERRK